MSAQAADRTARKQAYFHRSETTVSDEEVVIGAVHWPLREIVSAEVVEIPPVFVPAWSGRLTRLRKLLGIPYTTFRFAPPQI